MTDRLLTIQRVALLDSVDFFRGLSAHVLASVAAVATEVQHAAGSRLMDEGADGDCMFVVAEGRVAIDQGGLRIAELGVGEVVGELAVLSPGPRNATAFVIEPALLLRLDAAVIDELLLDHPEVARGIIDVLVRRLRSGLQ